MIGLNSGFQCIFEKYALNSEILAKIYFGEFLADLQSQTTLQRITPYQFKNEGQGFVQELASEELENNQVIDMVDFFRAVKLKSLQTLLHNNLTNNYTL